MVSLRQYRAKRRPPRETDCCCESRLTQCKALFWEHAATIATMTSKGQIAIPAEMRAKLRLGPGSKVDFTEGLGGEVIMRPVTGDVRRLRGLVTFLGPAVTIEDMNAAIAREASRGFTRAGGDRQG